MGDISPRKKLSIKINSNTQLNSREAVPVNLLYTVCTVYTVWWRLWPWVCQCPGPTFGYTAKLGCPGSIFLIEGIKKYVEFVRIPRCKWKKIFHRYSVSKKLKLIFSWDSRFDRVPTNSGNLRIKTAKFMKGYYQKVFISLWDCEI